jgi:hypothetical protein
MFCIVHDVFNMCFSPHCLLLLFICQVYKKCESYILSCMAEDITNGIAVL